MYNFVHPKSTGQDLPKLKGKWHIGWDTDSTKHQHVDTMPEMPLNALFSMKKLISVAIYILKMFCMNKRMISDSDKIPFLWSLLMDPSEWSLFFISWSLFPVFSDHSSQKLLKVASFIFKGGISMPGWSLSWENLPKNYSPGSFSLKVLNLESKHIWNSSLMVAKTTYDCSGKFTKCCDASHWLPWTSCPSVWQLRRAFGGTHSLICPAGRLSSSRTDGSGAWRSGRF